LTTTTLWLGQDDLETRQARVAFRERLLLFLAGLFVTVTYSGLIIARRTQIGVLWMVAVWIGCAAVGHIILSRRLPHRDPLMFPVAMLIAGWGLILISRLEPFFAARQAVWLIVSVAVMVALSFAPRHLRWLSSYRYLWLFSGLGLLALTILIGSNPSGFGPRLWIGMADIYLQPSELLKVILVAFLASYLTDHQALLTEHSFTLGSVRIPLFSFLVPLLIMWGFCLIILLWQRDLGTATLFFVMFILMLYIASGRKVYLFGGGGLLLLVAVVAYEAFDVVRQRVDIWYNPWPEAQNRAYQIVQSLLAFAAGGVFGQGVGQGSPSYIPVVHSDFVFAALAEEWGLLGTLAVTACILLLVMRGLRLALLLHQRPFHALLASGLSITLAVQSLLIMGGALKLIPLTGVTLPFLSYGGSSLLVSFIMLGILLMLSEDQ
jgi:cell division protein FtsW (lipid II flippase)